MSNLLSGLAEQTVLNAKGLIKSPENSLDFGRNGETFVLVPGINCNSGAVSKLGEKLKEIGNVVYSPDFSYLNTGDIYKNAQILAEEIERIQKEVGNINIFGHSLGGIIAVQSVIGEHKFEANRIITGGAPFQGAPLAKLMFFSKAARQINIKGGFMKDKNIDKRVRELISLISTDDHIVPPRSQLIPSGLHSNFRNKIMGSFDHTDFIIGRTEETVDSIKEIVEN